MSRAVQGRSRGVTLVEILIAIAVLGIVFGVLAATQATTLRVTAESRSASDATDFANREMERAVRNVLLDYQGTLDTCPVASAACTEPVSSGTRFAGSVTAHRLGSTYLQEGLVLVRVDLTAPAPVSFSRVLSCMDVDPPPSVASSGPCPPPVVP